MARITANDIDNPRMKKDAGKLARTWYRFRYWQDRRRYKKNDNKRKHVVKTYYSLGLLAIVFIVLSRMFTQSSSVQSTALNKSTSFGNAGKSVTLTKRVFNPNTGTLVLSFKIEDGDNSDISTINLKKLKLSFDGSRFKKFGNQTKLTVYPTSQNTIALQYENVKKNFQDVTVTFHDKTPNSNDVNAVSSLSSSTNSTNKYISQDATIVVNNDKVSIDDRLGVSNQKELAIQQVDDDIATQNKLIKANQKSITKLNDLISDEQKDLANQKSQSSAITEDDQTQLQALISSDEAKIQSLKDKISDAKAIIKTSKDHINTLENNKEKLQDGEMNLPKPF